MSRFIKRYIILLLLLGGAANLSVAQEVENVSQYRFGVEMDWKLFNVKGLKLTLEPQLRRDNDFSHESMVIESSLQYRTFGFLYWGVNYRLTLEPTEVFNKIADSYGRYGVSLTAKEDFGRFTPSLRVLYSNYTDDDIDDKEYMRYRAKLKYDTRKCPLNPYISAELYHGLEEGLITKSRYGVGVDYKIKKNNYLNLDYKLDYYALKYKNRHIFSLGYKVSF